ncbi:MAG: hypothetical protein ACPGXX_03030 [Planctomycetaceae bacterium]
MVALGGSVCVRGQQLVAVWRNYPPPGMIVMSISGIVIVAMPRVQEILKAIA